ncbi:MAG: methylmalonyl-CoA mutase family protein, partial [Fidelibacterota bacterium]
DRGLDPNVFGPRLSFFFNAHNHFLTEIAKYRAARRLWANLMKDRFHVTNPKAQLCRFHTQTGGSTLTAQQIDNNIVRTTIQALSAVLGGTQSLHTNSKDEALALPTDETARLALRTQQIIAYESGIADYPDPFGGSYVIEELTDQLESDARALIAQIDDMGGAVKAIEQGWIQNEIARSAYEYQQNIDSGEQVIIGINKFSEESETDVELLNIDKEQVHRQRTNVIDYKKNRDNMTVRTELDALSIAAGTSENLMPYIVQCVRAECTLGEITDALRSVFGEYKDTF